MENPSNNERATTPLGNNNPPISSLPSIGIGYDWSTQGYRAYLIGKISSIPYSHQSTRYIREQLTEWIHTQD
jgi:hypothetical protein